MEDHLEDEEERALDKNLEDSRIGFMRFGYPICIGIQSSAGKVSSIQELGSRNPEMDLFSGHRNLVSNSQCPCEGFVGYKTGITGESPAEGSWVNKADPPLIDQCYPILAKVTSNLRAIETDFSEKPVRHGHEHEQRR